MKHKIPSICWIKTWNSFWNRYFPSYHCQPFSSLTRNRKTTLQFKQTKSLASNLRFNPINISRCTWRESRGKFKIEEIQNACHFPKYSTVWIRTECGCGKLRQKVSLYLNRTYDEGKRLWINLKKVRWELGFRVIIKFYREMIYILGK